MDWHREGRFRFEAPAYRKFLLGCACGHSTESCLLWCSRGRKTVDCCHTALVAVNGGMGIITKAFHSLPSEGIAVAAIENPFLF